MGESADRRGPAVVAAGLAAVLALGATAACSRGDLSQPPAETSVPATPQAGQAPTPSVPPGPGPGSAHKGSVPADTYAAIVRAIKASGLQMQDETGLRMTYGADKGHVTVFGSFREPGGTFSTMAVEVRSENGKWARIR